MYSFGVGDNVGKWDDDDCETAYAYVCKKSASTNNTEPPSPPLCEEPSMSDKDFYRFNGACYKLVNEAKSWVEADQHCKEMGANLVSIMDTIEQAYVFVTVEMEDTWIGLNNREVILRNIFIEHGLIMKRLKYKRFHVPNFNHKLFTGSQYLGLVRWMANQFHQLGTPR